MEALTWAAIGFLAAFAFGGFFYLGSKIDGLGGRVDGLASSLGARIDGLGSRVDAMNAGMNAQARDLGARIDALYERVLPPGKTGASP